MTHYAQLLTNTIQKSAANSIILHKLLNYYIEEWFKSNLQQLGKLETAWDLNNEYLTAYAAENKIYYINLYDQKGNREKYSHLDRQCLNYQTIIQPILRKETNVSVYGIQPMSDNAEEVYIIAVARPQGGAIVGAMKAQRFTAIQGVVGIERYLNTIATDSSIIYIAIQDSSRIIAKTDNLDPSHLSALKKTATYRNIKSFQWENSSYQNKQIFEVSTPLTILHNQYYGVLRIGLDYSPIQKMQKDLLQRIPIRLLVLLIVGFILFLYSISIQNVHIMEKEKAKITNEVYLLQHNLRHKEKMSAIGELATGIAHEIRNPLSAISMTVQRLEREYKPTDGNAEQKRLFDIVRKEIDHIGASVKQLLQYSKPAPLQISPHRLDQIIDKIVKLYRSKAAEAGITLVWNNPTEVTASIDSEKIRECLINILENALAATPPKGTISIELKHNKREIIIIIQDTGHGISQEDLPKIFNLYFTTKSNGTGFGLAYAQQIIAEHGGRIEVQSQSGKGSCFRIVLPLTK